MYISHFVKFISSHIVITCQELSLWNFQKHSMSNSCIQPLLLLQTPPPPQVTSSILIGYLWESWSQVIWRTTSNRNLSRKFQVLCCVINKGMLSTCFLLFTYFKSEVFYSSLSCGSQLIAIWNLGLLLGHSEVPVFGYVPLRVMDCR